MWPWPGFLWPGSIEAETLAAFSEVFALYGYEMCGNALDPTAENLEPDYEKIALYTKQHAITGATTITHVARQTFDGAWTSKLGPAIDIAHDRPNDYPKDGRYQAPYGVAMYFFKRRRGYHHRLKERVIRTLRNKLIVR
jgi:hypothetical protein